MPLSSLPLPSIALVLTSDQALIPTRPSVIKIDIDSSPAMAPTVPVDLMKTIDLRDVDPSEYQQFSYILRSESEIGVDNEETRTIFEEKRPVTSRGFQGEGSFSNVVKDIASVVIHAFRKLFPLKVAQSVRCNIYGH
ncbi:hypothetical protein BDZ97DRAFT_1760576 [Flammula alnicola]|nr:hypothetical protein BDZ97DRAFT_1760576 [Flammula alnicola]